MMIRLQVKAIALVLTFPLVTGACASIPRDRGLEDVNDLLRERDAVLVDTATDAALLEELLAEPLAADDAVRVAMLRSPDVRAALAELDIAAADLLEMSSIRNPVFSGEIKFADGGYDPFEFSITQSILDLVQIPRRRQIGRAEFEVAKARVAATLMELGADVRSSYWALLAARTQVAFAQEVADSARVAAELALRQHEAGTITDLELENQQMLYEDAKLAQAEAEERAIVAEEMLAAMLGLGARDVEWRVPAELPPFEIVETDMNQLQTMLEQRRIDLLLLRRQGDAIARRAGIERWSEIGDLSAGVVVEREHDGERLHGVTASIPIPIFNFGRASAMRSRAQLELINAQIDGIVQRSAAELRAAARSFDAAAARAAYYRDVIIPRRERILNLTQLEYNGMLVGVYQLLQARQNLLDARSEYVAAQLGYWDARTALDRVVNGIGSIDLPSPAQSRGAARPASTGGH